MGTGGTTGTTGSGGAAAGTGGISGSGGRPGSGGSVGSGGAMGTGGTTGTTGSGGAAAGTGGATGSGGRSGSGGSSMGSGGAPGTGGRSGSGGRAGTGGTTGTGGGSGSCPHVQLMGNNICTIGDSWIQIPGNQVTTLQDHMRMAGVIPSNGTFDRREVSGSRLSAIINTYNSRPANCRILVMNGGGIDLFSTPLGPEQAAVTNVVNMFKSFLDKLKADGYVEHVVYSLYPVIPTTQNLNANMKPGYSAACAASPVHCVLVDLEPLFMGQHIASDRTHPDNAGGVIIGDAWWKAMQDNCIGQ